MITSISLKLTIRREAKGSTLNYENLKVALGNMPGIAIDKTANFCKGSRSIGILFVKFTACLQLDKVNLHPK